MINIITIQEESSAPQNRLTEMIAGMSMEGASWHYSHLEGKQIFGYLIFGTNISDGNLSQCYYLQCCCKENGSKIDMTVRLLDTLPKTDARVFLQMDSW